MRLWQWIGSKGAQVLGAPASFLRTRPRCREPSLPEPGPALPSSAGQEAHSTLSPPSAESLVLTEGSTLTQGPRARLRSQTPVRTGSCVRWESPCTSSPLGKGKAWGLRSQRSTTTLVASQPSSQPVGARGLKTRACSGHSLALSLRKAQGLGRERG